MKKLIFIIGLFVSCALSAQTSTQPQAQGYGRNRYDANGNIIGRDSVIVYNWSSNGGNQQKSQEEMEKMFNDMGQPFSFGFDFSDPWGSGLQRDSTYKSPFDDFFNNDGFFNMPSMQEMIEKQQRMMEEMQKRYSQPNNPNSPSAPSTPKDEKEEKKKNQKRKSISI